MVLRLMRCAHHLRRGAAAVARARGVRGSGARAAARAGVHDAGRQGRQGAFNRRRRRRGGVGGGAPRHRLHPVPAQSRRAGRVAHGREGAVRRRPPVRRVRGGGYRAADGADDAARRPVVERRFGADLHRQLSRPAQRLLLHDQRARHPGRTAASPRTAGATTTPGTRPGRRRPSERRTATRWRCRFRFRPSSTWPARTPRGASTSPGRGAAAWSEATGPARSTTGAACRRPGSSSAWTCRRRPTATRSSRTRSRSAQQGRGPSREVGLDVRYGVTPQTAAYRHGQPRLRHHRGRPGGDQPDALRGVASPRSGSSSWKGASCSTSASAPSTPGASATSRAAPSCWASRARWAVRAALGAGRGGRLARPRQLHRGASPAGRVQAVESGHARSPIAATRGGTRGRSRSMRTCSSPRRSA